MGEDYTDETIVTFGIHKGKTLADVPGSYLLYLYESQKGISDPRLLKYVEENYKALEMERNNQN